MNPEEPFPKLTVPDLQNPYKIEFWTDNGYFVTYQNPEPHTPMNTPKITTTPYKFGIGTFKTGDGGSATVGAIRPHPTYPLVGWVNETMQLRSWTTDGRVLSGEESGHDLMPPEPEMVRVPLEMDDVPQGAEFRRYTGKARFCPGWIGAISLSMPEKGITHFRELMDDGWEMRAPGGEWVPCWKEVAK